MLIIIFINNSEGTVLFMCLKVPILSAHTPRFTYKYCYRTLGEFRKNYITTCKKESSLITRVAAGPLKKQFFFFFLGIKLPLLPSRGDEILSGLNFYLFNTQHFALQIHTFAGMNNIIIIAVVMMIIRSATRINFGSDSMIWSHHHDHRKGRSQLWLVLLLLLNFLSFLCSRFGINVNERCDGCNANLKMGTSDFDHFDCTPRWKKLDCSWFTLFTDFREFSKFPKLQCVPRKGVSVEKHQCHLIRANGRTFGMNKVILYQDWILIHILIGATVATEPLTCLSIGMKKCYRKSKNGCFWLNWIDRKGNSDRSS